MQSPCRCQEVSLSPGAQCGRRHWFTHGFSEQLWSPSNMRPSADFEAMILTAWQTNCRATEYLVGHIPDVLWASKIPGNPRRTVRSIGAHLHNSRCGWTRTLGAEFGVPTPQRVDPKNVTQRQLVAALKRSSHGIAALLKMGCANGGKIPPSRAYVWRNLPLDVGHVLAYFVAHEGHHRGQLTLIARQLNRKLPSRVTDGIWQFRAFSRGSASPR